VFAKQIGVDLSPRGSWKKFAVITVARGADRRLAHPEAPNPGDAPHHKAWQCGRAGRFPGNCRSAGPPEPLAENFVEEVAELFSRSDARRIYDAVVGRSRFDGPIRLAQLTENP
jgi:hypothetical protein